MGMLLHVLAASIQPCLQDGSPSLRSTRAPVRARREQAAPSRAECAHSQKRSKAPTGAGELTPKL